MFRVSRRLFRLTELPKSGFVLYKGPSVIIPRNKNGLSYGVVVEKNEYFLGDNEILKYLMEFSPEDLHYRSTPRIIGLLTLYWIFCLVMSIVILNTIFNIIKEDTEKLLKKYIK